MLKQNQSTLVCRLLGLMSCISLLSSCGGTGQDSGTDINLSNTKTYSGIVLDGNIARALVFIDFDNNRTRDPWEPFAFTDDAGYYSYNPMTNTDYCASTATTEQQQYCLKSDRDLSNVVVRIDGGYDVLTGEPFLGQMSRKVTVTEGADTIDAVISPLTTLLTTASNQEVSSLLSSLEITEDDLNVNYLNTNGSGAINTKLFNTALKIHKSVTILSDRLQDTYAEIGEEAGTPNDMSGAIYDGIKQHVVQTRANINTVFNTREALDAAFANAEQEARVIYTRRDIPMPMETTQDDNANARRDRAISQAQNITRVIDAVMPVTAAVTPQNAVGRARAVEAMVIKSIEEGVNENPSFSNAVTFFLDGTKEALVNALVNSLSASNADIGSLVNNDFIGDDFDSEEEVGGSVQPPEGTTAFRQIANTQIRISDLDLGTAPNNLKDSEVEVYFNGAQDATSGSMTACVKYIDGASADGTLGDGNTRGELISGFWSLLGASEANEGSSYSLLMTITFLGTTYQAIMKPAGTETIDNLAYQRVRFDSNGEIRAWHSQSGFTGIESIPTSNDECRNRLPSRLGI